jgi:predicted metal-dependent HD superfamily phosphohydrolase
MPVAATSWQRAWVGCGAQTPGADLHALLLARYDEPQRAYHTLQHLHECLAWFEQMQPFAEHPAEVELALWFHDAVYDVHASDNEARSAAWAAEALRAAAAPADAAERVHALVMATCHHATPDGADAALLVDIDLAILGAEASRFAEYEAQIRREYAWVPEPTFREKRRAILASFQARPFIFSTRVMRDRLEAPARANLARAIAGSLD